MLGRKRQTIMLVDDNQANLKIGRNMLEHDYEVYPLPSAERLFTFLEKVTPDLILLDIAMPGMSGFDVIRILKADLRYAGIPVIFVTARAEESDELEGLALGAVDYVTKPFTAAILLKRIENHLLIAHQKQELKSFNENLIAMVKDKSARLSRLMTSMISTIAELVESRDTTTGSHVSRTQRYVELLVNRMMEEGVYAQEILTWNNTDDIFPSSQLHDIGKICISDLILNKPGKLTAEEFAIMKTHVTKGVEVIRMIKSMEEEEPFLNHAEVFAAFHHERWDGSGYPAGLKGEDIPLLGRLMAIADVYDALTTERPYKQAMAPETATDVIIQESGSHFDPTLVEVFRLLTEEFAQVVRGDCVNGPSLESEVLT